jgi:hypothetical protein
MKKNIVLPVLAALVLLFSGSAEAQQTQPLTVFPYTWETTDIPLYPVDAMNMCSADVVDTICEVNEIAGTLTTKEIPFSGTVPYSGTISGDTPYAGTGPFPTGDPSLIAGQSLSAGPSLTAEPSPIAGNRIIAARLISQPAELFPSEQMCSTIRHYSPML